MIERIEQTQRVEILIEQQRYSDAEQELRKLLSQNPNNVILNQQLADVLYQQDKTEEALDIINNTIGLQPNSDISFYIRCKIQLGTNKLKEAEKDIDKALEIAPQDADYFAIKAHLQLVNKKYREAVKYSENALSIDAENILALNVKTSAHTKLKEKDISSDLIQEALKYDPTNSYTHSNAGYAYLEQQEYDKALVHFKEALKNAPDNEDNKQGVVLALKSKYKIYDYFLRYSFWLTNLEPKYQSLFIFGLWIFVNGFSFVSENIPVLKPLYHPLLFIYVLFVVSTRTINDLFNMAMLFNNYGRLLLNIREKIASIAVTTFILMSIVSGISFYLTSDTNSSVKTHYYLTHIHTILGLEKLFIVSLFLSMLSAGISTAREKQINFDIYYVCILLLGSFSTLFTFLGKNVPVVYNLFFWGSVVYFFAETRVFKREY